MPINPHDDLRNRAVIPYSYPVRGQDSRIYHPVPAQPRRLAPILVSGVCLLVAAIAIGYGLGQWRAQAPATARVASADSVAVAGPDPAIVTPSAFDPGQYATTVDSSAGAVPFVEQPVVVPTQDTVVTTTTVEYRGYQTLTPPEDPPETIAPPPPPDATLSTMLYGQRLVAKTAFANYGWEVEPGEIIEFQVDRVWNDPAQISHGVYVTLVAMERGRGIRASGLLRYYDGEDSDGYVVRDFMPSSVVRVGSW
jgi:preprotein translocase subunit Sec61beta